MLLDGEGFIKVGKGVVLKPYVPRKPKPYELMTDEEFTNCSGQTLIGDSESYLNYFLIAFKNIKTGKIIKFEIIGDDCSNFNPRKLSWLMHSYTVIGFNINRYDIPIIWLSYANQNPETIQEMSFAIITRDLAPEVCESEYAFKIHKTRTVDIMPVCPPPGVSLKQYAGRIHVDRLQDLPFSVQVPLDIENGQHHFVSDYCISGDLEATEHIFNFMKDRFEVRYDMSREYTEDLMSKSDAQIAESVIKRELHKIDGRWPKRPHGTEHELSFHYKVPDYMNFVTPALQKLLETIRNAKFSINGAGYVDLPKEIDVSIPLNKGIYRLGIGGLHSYEKHVAYKADENYCIIDRDVASFYPRIILNQSLYPTHLGHSFLHIYKGIVERRLAAKKAGNKTLDKGLKVTINGTFGKTASIYSILYSPEMMVQITISGQLSLLMLIEAIELIGIQVVSANTDGIVILCPHARVDDLNIIVKAWEKHTGFETEETRYKSYYARDVNAYFAVKMDGEVKVKGSYAEVGSQTGTPIDLNPGSLICSDAVKKLLVDGTPIEKTIFDCQDIRRFITIRNVKGGAHKDGYYLGKVVRWYYAQNVVGTINYITSGNKVPDTDGALPAMDLPSKFPSDIDYAWYINKTQDILREIAYLPRAQQLTFF